MFIECHLFVRSIDIVFFADVSLFFFFSSLSPCRGCVCPRSQEASGGANEASGAADPGALRERPRRRGRHLQSRPQEVNAIRDLKKKCSEGVFWCWKVCGCCEVVCEW